MSRKRNGVRRTAGVLAVLTAVSLAGCGQTGKEALQAAADVAQVQETEQTAGADVQAREAEQTGVGEMQAESATAGEEAQGKTGSESAAGQRQSEATGKSVQADDGMRRTFGAANDRQQTEQTNGEKERQTQSKKKEPPAGWQLTLASEDWGPSFGEPGTQSVGNASSEDLAWYDAYYVGSDDEKLIYLTFDCGYENGNT